MESSSLKWKHIEVKIESEKMVFENIVKPKVEIKGWRTLVESEFSWTLFFKMKEF